MKISSHLASLFWAALFVTVLMTTAINLNLFFTDFVNVNPHRSKENAMSMMLYGPLTFGSIFIIESMIVFAVPQLFSSTVGAEYFTSTSHKSSPPHCANLPNHGSFNLVLF